MVKQPGIQLTMISSALLGMVVSLLFFYLTIGFPVQNHSAELHTKKGTELMFQQFLSEESEVEFGEKSQEIQKAGFLLFLLPFAFYLVKMQKSTIPLFRLNDHSRFLSNKNPIYLEIQVLRN